MSWRRGCHEEYGWRGALLTLRTRGRRGRRGGRCFRIGWRSVSGNGLLEQIKPYYPQAGKGRVPCPLESMLRMYWVQIFYNISDPAMEDMLYEVENVGC